MVDQLFGSKTRVKLLRLFFSNPNRSFYVREITRKIDEQINSVRRELANLLSIGIITSDSTNNKLYYEVNQAFEYYDALGAMFSDAVTAKKKSAPKSQAPPVNDEQEVTVDAPAETTDSFVELPEAKKWAKVGNVAAVAYSGAYTRDETAGVDILVIGDVLISKVEAVIVDLEREKSRELRYAVMEVDEWDYRRQVRDKFWLQFNAAKKQIVLDKHNSFVEK